MDDAAAPYRSPAVLPPNAKKRKTTHSPTNSMESPSFTRRQHDDTESQISRSSSHELSDDEECEDTEEFLNFIEIMRRGQQDDDPEAVEDEDSTDNSGDSDIENDEDLSPPEMSLDGKFKTPVIMPRMRFSGHCNIETVKDGTLYAIYGVFSFSNVAI